jgi:hydroxymethylpyrimidine pyrophosphatase-like HAD family hydrolase
LSSLMESLGRAHLSVKPDYLVLVEREIYCHQNLQYVGLAEWNQQCTEAHAELFVRVRADLPHLISWVNERFTANLYEDAYSPFCLIAERNEDADVIYDFLLEYATGVPNLTVVRNDVYARFSHASFNKGTALSEIARRLGITPEHTFAAGDHLNDLPMLSNEFARWLAAPANAIDTVKALVRRQSGYVSHRTHGPGIAESLRFFLNGKG